jgi:hypothetical protein
LLLSTGMEKEPTPRPGRLPEVRVKVGEDWVSYRLRVAALRGATTHLILRCAPDGEIYASIEHVAD